MDFHYTCFPKRAPGLLVVSEQPEADDSWPPSSATAPTGHHPDQQPNWTITVHDYLDVKMFNQLYLNNHTIIYPWLIREFLLNQN